MLLNWQAKRSDIASPQRRFGIGFRERRQWQAD